MLPRENGGEHMSIAEPEQYEMAFQPHPERLNLHVIASSLMDVEEHWDDIDNALEEQHIGRKDRFTDYLRRNMESAYAYLDALLAEGIRPFSPDSIRHMLVLNERVHYGTNVDLMHEYSQAIKVNEQEYFLPGIERIASWVTRHRERRNHPLKIAAEVYVAVLSRPQLFNEGNHRTGTLISDWISLYYGFPPFVLSLDNALAYFAPSAQIKHFADKSSRAGLRHLPKYHKSFRRFWEQHIDSKYLMQT
jgi:hypothetical protein